jgi:hypothetical protein
MATPVGFNANDFFYNNVNAPIKFDNSLCNLSDTDLKAQIQNQYNIAITQQAQPTISNTAGQCTMTKIDTSTMSDDQKSKLTKNWKLQISTSGGKQSCKCAADNTYISADKNVFSTQFGSPVNNEVYYSCTDSTPVTIQDNGASTVQLDETQKGKLMQSTFDYYKSVCKNKVLSEEIIGSLTTNEYGDQKYEDMKSFYNKEYLTRINLGIGIFMATGLMYFTLNTKGIVPLPK